MPSWVLWAAGLVEPDGQELRETQHQFRRPFVLDSSGRTARPSGLCRPRSTEAVRIDLEAGAPQGIKA